MFWYDDDESKYLYLISCMMFGVVNTGCDDMMVTIFTNLEIQQKLLMRFRLIVLIPYLVK